MGKIVVIIGTRPECIKIAPLIHEMTKRGFRNEIILVNTGQHKELLQSAFTFFGIAADHTLDVMIPGQSLNTLTARILTQLQQLHEQIETNFGKPGLLVAQGDTATAFAASVTAFHNRIPFAHIEAGLRTHDFENPFPEEYYRKCISINAYKYFTPTLAAGNNLLKEGISPEKILFTGNTGVDSLEYIGRNEILSGNSDLLDKLHEKKIVLITCHRRENFGENFEKITGTIKSLAEKHLDHSFVWVQHPNPMAKDALERSEIGKLPNIYSTPPLDYFDMIRLFPHVKLLITDSGGLQEEAPSFKVPVIILRETTERMESVEKGYAFLCGADREKIVQAFDFCFTNEIRITHNPYGDGKASERIADYLVQFLKLSGTNSNLSNSNEGARA
jgi:UDP-N-acetylglucosamine 2-epimerase (non-hydrolysing)